MNKLKKKKHSNLIFHKFCLAFTKLKYQVCIFNKNLLGNRRENNTKCKFKEILIYLYNSIFNSYIGNSDKNKKH